MTMARKYSYSLDRKDAKVAGVASTIGAMTGIDPTLIRIGFVAAAIFVSFKLTLIGHAAERRPTTHAMVHDLDETDRRLMAIDHHINTQNEELAREIEALRQEDK